MTKKQLIALADHIKRDHAHPMGYVLFDKETIHSLADFCATQNPNFKRERWLDYIEGECGKNGGRQER